MKKCIKWIMLFMAFVCIGCTQFDFSKYDGKYVNPEYDANFEQMIGGEIHPQQDWGFYSVIGTRASQPNSNQWGTDDDNGKYKDYPKPDDISAEELAAVLAVFNEKGKEKYEPLVNLQNFFVQQVWCGEFGPSMNQLSSVVDYKVEVVSWWPYEEKIVPCEPYHDEYYNFNNGKYNGDPLQGCMLMWNSSTTDFGFKTSESNGQWVDAHWRMEYIAPYGYFVGFDHESWTYHEGNENENNARDYVYNDWIIKLVPGLGFEFPGDDPIVSADTIYAVRIMGEDLGTTDDFDFNDIVIDVHITDDYVAHITLQAAGGTMPIYIGPGDKHEVHKEFNVPVYTMVNTGSGPSLPAVQFDLDGEYFHPRDVEIRVEHGNFVYALTADVGKTPQKFACPIGTAWMKERHDIITGYPNFSEWATKKAPRNWYDYVYTENIYVK